MDGYDEKALMEQYQALIEKITQMSSNRLPHRWSRPAYLRRKTSPSWEVITISLRRLNVTVRRIS